MQTPLVQVPLHAWLHPPQLVLLVWVSTQLPLHIICPATVQEHWLLTHVVPPVQAWPQDPQLLPLVVVSTQAPPEHCIWPLGQPVEEQAPFAQTCVPVQVFPHIPQLLESC
jgi:hypothetical protein